MDLWLYELIRQGNIVKERKWRVWAPSHMDLR